MWTTTDSRPTFYPLTAAPLLSGWSLAVIVAVFVLAVDLVRAHGASDRCGGAGPAQITVRRGDCMCAPTPAPPSRMQDGTYLYEYESRRVICACEPHPEIWSDYPECGGWRLR